METSSLKYPKKSHRKIITLPAESKELAELMGIIFGDGGIGNPWQLVISLNSIKDLEYSRYINTLLTSLFGITVAIRKRPNQNTLVLVSSSMNLVDFLVSKGAVRGNKIKQQIDIPNWIRNTESYEKAVVRGLMDTDGCLFIHRHTIKGIFYRNISLCFTSFSPNLIISVANILNKFEIKPYITNKGRQIYLYKQASVIKYLDVFGSSNPRLTNLFHEWRGARVV